jgi:8-oxo-dGTP diphosphatase
MKPNRKHIDVSLAALVVEDQVLLVRRSEPDQRDIDDLWELPGGKIEPGERPEDAAVRELVEETGHSASVGAQLPLEYHVRRVYSDFELTVSIVCFLCQSLGTSAPAAHTSKVSAQKWVSIADLDWQEVLPGSRDFVLWIADRLALEANSLKELIKFHYIVLHSIDTSENRKRFYEITLRISPETHKYLLAQYWGRSGARRLKYRLRECSTAEEAYALIAAICRTRFAHNYKITSVDPRFPMRQWLAVNRGRMADCAAQLPLWS